jgi:hypothetical protein
MDAMLWLAGALILSILLSIVVALRELRRRNFALAGLALACLISCVAALVQPMRTHAVLVDLPVRVDGG